MIYLIHNEEGDIVGRSTRDPRPILLAIQVEDAPVDAEINYKVVGDTLVMRDTSYQPPTSYVYQRMNEYDIYQQLNLLVDDITEGKFGEEAKKSKFYQYVLDIKNRYPKN